MSRGLQVRQGDVLLEAVDTLPVHADLVAPLPVLRAWCRAGTAAAEWFEVTSGKVVVSHARYAPVTLAAGVWQVTRQREYGPHTASSLPRFD